MDFNTRVTEYDAAMVDLTKNITGQCFWRQRNPRAHWEDCLADGVDVGSHRYHNSVQGVIVAAIRKV